MCDLCGATAETSEIYIPMIGGGTVTAWSCQRCATAYSEQEAQAIFNATEYALDHPRTWSICFDLSKEAILKAKAPLN